jgi:hypothetical protein
MPSAKMIKEGWLTIKIEPELRIKIEKGAIENDRTMAAQVRHLIKQGIKQEKKED